MKKYLSTCAGSLHDRFFGSLWFQQAADTSAPAATTEEAADTAAAESTEAADTAAATGEHGYQ